MFSSQCESSLSVKLCVTTSVLSVFPHLALSPAVLISVLPLNIAYVQSYSH